jgi:hypothetical protein
MRGQRGHDLGLVGLTLAPGATLPSEAEVAEEIEAALGVTVERAGRDAGLMA